MFQPGMNYITIQHFMLPHTASDKMLNNQEGNPFVSNNDQAWET